MEIDATQPPLPPPPRTLPASLRWRILLGGALPTIGFATLAVGGFLGVVFAANSELSSWWRFRGELALTEGRVVAVDNANVRVNEEYVQAITFSYRALGRDRLATSYGRGAMPAKDEAIQIEYAVRNPDAARIPGFNSAPLPVWAAFPLLFTLISIGLIWFGWRKGRRRVWLMEHGHSAWGLLTSTSPTNTRINNQVVQRLTFAFVDANGDRATATDRSHHEEYGREDIARHVLYGDSVGRREGISCIVELLPSKPEVHNGAWQPVSLGGLLRVLIVPAIALAMIALATQVRF
ncbi:MAG: hypothetical protein AB8H80_00415 [Planctomycetota bacterium]